jgi:hypothetical protein
MGVDGIAKYSNQTWYNMFDAEPLTSARAATWPDLRKTPHFTDPNVRLDDVLEASTRVQVQDDAWLRSRFPYLSQLLKGQAPKFPDDDTRAQILNWVRGYNFQMETHDLPKAVRNFFLNDILADLSQQLKTATGVGGLDAFLSRSDVIDIGIDQLKRLGVPLSTWIPDIREPKDLFPNSPRSFFGSFTNTNQYPTGEYIQKVQSYWQFQDHQDFLKVIARGGSIENLYGEPGLEPYLDRWNQAQQYSYNEPEKIPRILSGKSTEGMREGPASSDGNIEWPLNSGKKYFEVNDRQIAALKENPYIHPEFISIPDPKSPGRSIQAARYDYPTVADFEKFQKWIEDPELIKGLQEAKQQGWITDPSNEKTKELSKKFMGEVFSKSYGNNPSTRRYLLTSLHPFSSMNAESLSVLYPGAGFGSKPLYSSLRIIHGKPDEILLMPIQDYQAMISSNNSRTLAILAGWAREEKNNPKFPKYFDIPEIWQVGLEVSDPGPDLARFVSNARAYFAQLPLPSCVAAQIKSKLNISH